MLSNRRVAIINRSIMTVLFSIIDRSIMVIIDRSIMTVVDNDHYRPVDNGKQYCHYRPVVVLSSKLLRPSFTKHYRPAHMRMDITTPRVVVQPKLLCPPLTKYYQTAHVRMYNAGSLNLSFDFALANLPVSPLFLLPLDDDGLALRHHLRRHLPPVQAPG